MLITTYMMTRGIYILENQKKFGEIVAKAWTDPSFKERLLQSPAAVLAEHGIKLPEGTQINILQDTETEKHFVLPSAPTTGTMGFTKTCS
ncbi:MAG: nitrile hydratase subunit alpha [Tumebacillaceae bacterium]